MNTQTEERGSSEDTDLIAVCVSCGHAAAGVPLVWTRQRGRSGPEWLCDNCTREHLREIESKLDDLW